MTPLNVVIVNDFAYVNGGASQVALDSAVALSEAGHKVHLFTAVGPPSEKILASGVQLTCLDQQEIAADSSRRRAVFQGLWNRRAAREMERLLRTLKPENTIVHFHVWVKSLSSSIAPVVRSLGFPAVVTLHDYFLACPNGGFLNYPNNEICRYRALSASCLFSNCDKRSRAHKVWRVLRQFIQRYVGQMPKSIGHFITISDLSEEVLRPYIPDSAGFYRVDNPIFVPKEPPPHAAESDTYLFLGRLDPEKGPLLFAEAAREVGVKPTFVGTGMCSEEISRAYPEARMTGWVDADQVTRELRAARVLVFPSIWYETLGLTVLEAAAVGIPSIVPDSSAAREMVCDGETGLVFVGGDKADLAEKIKRMMDDDLVTRLGEEAYRRYWSAPKTVDKHVGKLTEVYSSMLSQA